MKIKKRDVKAFILGAVTILIVDLILNWNEFVEAFMEGFKEGTNFSWIFF